MTSVATPTILYKYMAPSGLRLLSSQSVRFTPPHELNDPFESRLPEVIRLVSASSSGKRHVVFPENEQRLLATIGNTYGITCFSEVPDELLMWAHYAQAHSGMVIGFRTGHDSFAALGSLLPVSYRNKRPVVSSKTPKDSIVRILTTKSQHWKYEREWRLLTGLVECSRTGKLFLKSLDPECIECVILGVRVNQTLRRKVMKWKAGHPQTRVLQARLDSLRFGLSLDENLESEPTVVVADQRHLPVGFDLPFASVVEMRHGTLFVRNITDKFIAETDMPSPSHAHAPRTQIIIHDKTGRASREGDKHQGRRRMPAHQRKATSRKPRGKRQ